MDGIATRIKAFDLFYGLLFIFFLTLHADQLNITCGPYTIRYNNLIAFLLFFMLLFRLKASLFIQLDSLFVGALGFVTLSLLASFLVSHYKFRCFFFLGMWILTLMGYVFIPYFLMIYFDVWRILRLYLASYLYVGGYALLQLLLSLCGYVDPFVTQWIIDSYICRTNAFAYEPSFYALYMTPFIVIMSLHYWIGKKRDALVISSLTFPQLVLIYLTFLASTATTAIFSCIILFSLIPFLPIKARFPHLKRNFFQFLAFFSCAMTVFSCLFPSFAMSYFYKFFYVGFTQHHSFAIRWTGIVNALKLFLQFPLLGVGFGAMPVHYYHVWLTKDPTFVFPIEYELLYQYVNPLKLFEPTNVITELLGSLGLLGLMSFLLLLCVFCKKAAEAFQKGTLKEQEWIFLLITSFFVALIVLQFNQGLFRTYIWSHYALAYGFMCRVCKDNHKRLKHKDFSLVSN